MPEPTSTPAPAPKTRKCYDCGTEIATTEKECPKCKSNLEDADAEDGVVEKALKRIAAKNKEKRKNDPAPQPQPPAKKSLFSSLNRRKHAPTSDK